MAGHKCSVCEEPFSPRRSGHKTCSLECSVQWRRHLSRERQRKFYQKRPPRPDTECEHCKAIIRPPRTGRMPRWCQTCNASREQIRARKRVAIRRCYKCQVPLVDAARRPGKAVCEDCRVDKRHRDRDHEQRRRLRKYGITQVAYDQLLTKQCGRCPGCGTDQPGVKGWAIDHCHRSGKVRALLCMRCNTMLGLANEDPSMLRALADFAEQMNEIKI
jgi:hypothetical protein